MEELIDLQTVQQKKEEAEDCFELEPNASSLTLLQKVYRSSSVALQTRMRAAIARYNSNIQSLPSLQWSMKATLRTN